MSVRYGCYSIDHRRYRLGEPEEAELPLKNLTYDIELADSLAFLQLEQTYINNLDKILNVQYIFPVNPNAVIYDFEISFGCKKVKGIIKSKEDAKKEFKEQQDEGRQAAYGGYDRPSTQDVMKVKLGNVSAGQEIKVKISYVHTVSIVMNTFYEFRLNTTITPRYVSKLEPQKLIYEEKFDRSVEGSCSWHLRIRLRSSRPVKKVFSRTHKVNASPKQLAQDTWQVIIEEENMLPNKDFVLNYSFQDIDKPCVLLGESDTQTQALVSFVPRFCQLSEEKAAKLVMQSKQLPLTLNQIKAEYIFFLDRSGSMGGQRIAKAKEALIVFLKSLPSNSYFNVVSFGSSSELLYPESQRYTQESTIEAIDKIKTMDADLGGTEILRPLRICLNSPSKEEYPRHIFLLTDGAVDEVAGIKKYVGTHTSFSRVHTIGIGYGASEDLILGCALAGKGYSVMISDKEDPTDKIVDILDKSLSPVISKINFHFQKEKVESVVPNPEKTPYVLKNEVANFYFTFNGKLTHPFPVEISYTDSLGRTYCQKVLISPQQAPRCHFLSKLAAFQSLSALYSTYISGQDLTEYLYFVKKLNKEELQKEIIRLSIDKQLLCQLTAFICVDDSVPDEVSKKNQKQAKQSVKIRSMNPIEHPNAYRIAIGRDLFGVQDSSEEYIDQCAFGEPEFYRQPSQKELIKLNLPRFSTNLCSIDLQTGQRRQTEGVKNLTAKQVEALEIITSQDVSGMWNDKKIFTRLYNLDDRKLIEDTFAGTEKDEVIWTLALIQAIKTFYAQKVARKFVLILRKAVEYIDQNSRLGFAKLEQIWSEKVRSVAQMPQ